MSVRSIARELGVSPTAVSLALKDSPRVSAGLRTAVRRLVKSTGHVPNARLTELMREVREGARQRAEAYGYKLEDFWVNRPGLVILVSGDRRTDHLYSRRS
jgi:DNA-binding LacI/PurR family transcriptional regulator